MNFVFFFPDEMRADSVSCYGHPLVQMPNYDRIAAEGVRFDQCYTQHPVCSPSRCSLMTGWYPHVAGHRTLWQLLHTWEPSLFRDLKAHGYHIEWHGKNDLYAPDYFDEAVDSYSQEPGGHAGPNPYDLGDPRYYSFDYEPFPQGLHETSDMRNVQKGIDFMRQRQPDDPPFFLYLPLSMPHPPYAAPEPYHTMYDPNDVPPLRPADLPDKPDYHDLIRQYRRLDELDDAFLRKIRAQYLGMNSYCDWMLGQFLQTLEETGLEEDTVLIISADHGDWAGDYGLVEKWPSALDDCILRVPLLIRMPGNQAGHAIDTPVELFDIMATVYELAGIAPDHTHFAQSLAPQLHGAPGDAERAVFAEGGYDPHQPHCFEGRMVGRGASHAIFGDPSQIYYPKGLQQQEQPESVCRATMIRWQDFKLIRRSAGVHELYNMAEDPQELHNLYHDAAHGHIRQTLETHMLDWYIHTADVITKQECPRGLPPQSSG